MIQYQRKMQSLFELQTLKLPVDTVDRSARCKSRRASLVAKCWRTAGGMNRMIHGLNWQPELTLRRFGKRVQSTTCAIDDMCKST